MKFLPIENKTYFAPLTAAEVRERLAAAIEPKQMLRNPYKRTNTKPYEGHLNHNHFEINRIIRYRNSFLPQIKGQILPGDNGTEVKVKMRLSVFVYIFLIIWCGSLGLFVIAFSLDSMMEGAFDPVIFIPLGMLLFAYVMVTVGFKYEAKKAKKDLANLLEGKRNHS
jgi:hypothetical protein